MAGDPAIVFVMADEMTLRNVCLAGGSPVNVPAIPAGAQPPPFFYAKCLREWLESVLDNLGIDTNVVAPDFSALNPPMVCN